MTPSDRLGQWLEDANRPVWVMGVLNVTPDSFSDGGQFMDPEAIDSRVAQMHEEGADCIDIGGESTRPGSQPVDPAEQIRRVLPAVRSAVGRGAVVSIDTTRARVAEAAIDAGAVMVNDVSAARDDPAMLPMVARRGCALVLMHMQGTPQTMQIDPAYERDDVTHAVLTFLRERVDRACEAGIDPGRILLDPGIGFGKTTEHNLRLLRELPRLVEIGPPVLVGTSRKRFIGQITGVNDPAGRVFGTAATVAWAVANGAAAVRVHDIRAMRQVVDMTCALTRLTPENL